MDGELVHPGSELYGVVWKNPDRLGGKPCFFGTRVPVKSLFDYLAEGYSIEEFFNDFDGVTRFQVDQVLAKGLDLLTLHAGRAA